MADESTNAPLPAPPAKSSEPALTPEIIQGFVDSRIADVEASATKNVTKKIIQSLTGEKEKAQEHPIHKALIEKPAEFISTLIKETKEQAIKEMTAGNEIKEAAGTAFNSFAEEYPDLKKVKNEVLAEYAYTDPNLSVPERIKQASTKVVDRMGWKKKSEQKNEENIKNAAMSPGGYTTTRPELQGIANQLTESSSDFIKQRREQYLINTGKAPKPK